MKRIIALILSAAMLLAGCGQVQPQPQSQAEETIPEISEPATDTGSSGSIEPQYTSLDDPQLLAHVEDLVYRDAVTALNSDEYFVEDVSAIYVSKEYLDEVAFNSQSNIYFGYTLAELDEIFQDTKYIFTLSDDGTTTVKALQEIKDTSAETMLKNVAIGTGVILICVTVSVIPAGASASAITMIFAASAEKAATFALSSAAFGGISAGIIRGIQTDDFTEAMNAAAMGASEGFKWGAISGVIATGASYAKNLYAFKGKTLNGLTPSQAAAIQVESNLPVDIISQLHSMDEYFLYKNIGLKTMIINGKTALVQPIDLNYVSTLPDGTKVTNLARILRGKPALDPTTGKAYELHHVGQNNNGALAILTQDQHRGKGAFSKLHHIWQDSGVDHGPNWNKTVSDFWKSLGNYYVNGGV